MIMGMRLIKGINIQEIGLKEQFETALEKDPTIRAMVEEGYITYDPPLLRLAISGLFVSNTVIGKLCSTLFK